MNFFIVIQHIYLFYQSTFQITYIPNVICECSESCLTGIGLIFIIISELR